MGIISRILSPKNQDSTTPNALPESVTFLTQHKNDSIPEEAEEDIENEESTEDETTIVKEVPRKNQFLKNMKYDTLDILFQSDDSTTGEDHSQNNESSTGTKQSKTQTKPEDPSSKENLDIQQQYPQLT